MENLQAHMHDIDWDALPKTFKDAIITCRQLGIEYLFIDRLCIVQNPKSDWEKQSGVMGSIYHDSTLTLAAAVSNDSSTGLFVPMRPSESCEDDLVLLPPSFGDHRGQAFFDVTDRKGLGDSLPVDRATDHVLDTRGWVMQEKYLARRTLYFLKGGMVW